MNKKLLWILALALFIRLLTFSGYQESPDEMANVDIVKQIVRGHWPTYHDEQYITEMILPVRIGFVGSVAGIVKIFGFSDFSITLYPLCASLLAVLVVFFLGRLWISETGGLWGAFLLAVFPLDIIFSTKLYSESILTFWCALGVLLFFLAEQEASGTPRRRHAWFAFLSGLVIGFAYLHKVTAGYFLILFALIALARMMGERRIAGRYFYWLLGFGLVFAFEMGFHTVLHDDPLYRWHVYARQGASLKMIAALRGQADRSLGGALERLFWNYPLSSLVSFRFGAFYWFVFPAFFYCLLRRRKKLWPLLLWWGLMVPLSVLSTYFGGLPFIARQTTPFTVPGLLLLAAVLAETRQWTWLQAAKARRRFLVFLAATTLFSFAATLSLWAVQKPLLDLLIRLYLAKTVMPLDEQVVGWVLQLFSRYLLLGALALTVFFAVQTCCAWRGERRQLSAWPNRLAAPLIAGFLAIGSTALAYSENRGFPHFEKEAFLALRELPPKPIYADWYTKQILDFHLGFPEEESVVEFDKVPLDTVHDAYLVYNVFRKNMAARMEKSFAEMGAFPQHERYFSRYDQVDQARSDHWKLVRDIQEGMILIYYIP